MGYRKTWKGHSTKLRCTCAKLCRKAGGNLEQIQMLGHASVQTTERYLDTDQNLTIAVNDVLGSKWIRFAPRNCSANQSWAQTA